MMIDYYYIMDDEQTTATRMLFYKLIKKIKN